MGGRRQQVRGLPEADRGTGVHGQEEGRRHTVTCLNHAGDVHAARRLGERHQEERGRNRKNEGPNRHLEAVQGGRERAEGRLPACQQAKTGERLFEITINREPAARSAADAEDLEPAGGDFSAESGQSRARGAEGRRAAQGGRDGVLEAAAGGGEGEKQGARGTREEAQQGNPEARRK